MSTAIVTARKKHHAAMEGHISEHGGWLVSVPGAVVIRFEALPDSKLPDDLRALGYVVTPAGSTMRILPFGTTEIIAAAESCMPPVRVLHHAGIVQTSVFELTVPPGGLRE